MNRVNAVSPSPNHVTQTSVARPSPSRAGVAVCVATLGIVGLTSVPMIAHAASIRVGCQPATQLIGAIFSAVSGDVLSLDEGCIFDLTLPLPTTADGLPPIKIKLTIKGNGAIIMRSTATGTPPFRLIEVASTGDLTLDNVTLENGLVTGTAFTTGRGGAIYNLGALTVINGTLSHNHAALGGGGIGNGDPSTPTNPNPLPGKLTLDKGTLLFNNSVGPNANGGGIASGSTSTMNLTDCTISDNFANLPGSGVGPSGGGGIASQGTAILNKCTITGNTAFTGGGISNAGQLVMTDSPVTGNHAIADNNSSTCPFTGLGGGIFNAPDPGSTVTLIHSPVTGNEAIAANSSSGCIIANIENTGLGGGIVNATFNGVFGIATLTNSDVSGNRAASGGGIANAGPMTLTRSNVTGNNSTGDGGGIYNLTDRGNNIPIAALTLTHSDVIGNNAGKGQHGGGISNEIGNTVTLNQSTVTGNSHDF